MCEVSTFKHKENFSCKYESNTTFVIYVLQVVEKKGHQKTTKTPTIKKGPFHSYCSAAVLLVPAVAFLCGKGIVTQLDTSFLAKQKVGISVDIFF